MYSVGNEVSAPASESGALEHIDNVVHHDIHASKLTKRNQCRPSLSRGINVPPHLQASTEDDTTEDIWLEQIDVALCTLCPLEINLLPDFLELELHEGVVFVSLAMQVGENLERLILVSMVEQPSRGLREPEHADRKHESRYHLDTPRDAEGRRSVDVRAAELNEELG